LENGSYSGTLTVTDPEGAELSENFTVTIVESPLEITIPNYYIYGSTNNTLRVFGTLGLSIFDRENYQENIAISYALKDEKGTIVDSGQGEFDDEHFKFRLDVNTSSIGSRQLFETLYESLGVLPDLYNSSSFYPSGEYSLEVSAEDSDTNQLISKTYTSISITVDSDGDFITDDLEPGYSVDVTTIYPWSTDSDDDGIVDPVEVVLGSDLDDDGLTNERELVLGTNMTNADTDGDGLKDGFDSEGFGEANHGTNPLKNDTDGDKLLDGAEVEGWNVRLIDEDEITTNYHVTSDPKDNDTDDDGLADSREYFLRSDPTRAHTDADNLDDQLEDVLGTTASEYDSDKDRMSDYAESQYSYHATWVNESGIIQSQPFYCDPLSNDTDEDGLSDYDEVYTYFTNAANMDTDEDALIDFEEVHTYGTVPLDSDTDDDGLSDGFEVNGLYMPLVKISDGVYDEEGTQIKAPKVENVTIYVTSDPLKADTDGDGLSDY
jgi:hypothetical protein